MSAEDRVLRKEIEDSLKVSSYIGDIFDNLATGRQVNTQVPDYSNGMNKQSVSNESNSLFSIFDSGIFANLQDGSPDGVPDGNYQPIERLSNTSAMTPPGMRSVKLSSNQKNALKRYPALVDFLGTDHGDKIAQVILEKVNAIMVDKIASNSQEIDKNARTCVADGANIKQYFSDEDKSWVCRVVACGPFRGDEAFYYKPGNMRAQILRKTESGEYQNVSGDFNIVHEFQSRD